MVQARQFLVCHWSAPAGRAFSLADTVATLPRPSPSAAPPPQPQLPPAHESERASLRAAREEYDRRLVATALERTGGNLSEACRLLGIFRNTLKARIRHYGLAAVAPEGAEMALDQASSSE
jgi:DNA-binding NtrC family response regulator